MKKLASIIIVNYNGRKFLKDCLSSVLNQSYKNYEIIFVDNASIDDSVDFVKKNFPSAKIIQSKQNLGFAGGNNLGIKASKGDYIVLLNNDTVVKPNWLEELVKASESDSQIGIVGSKLLFPDGRINSTGHYFSYKSCGVWDRGIGENDRGQYDGEENQDVLSVCFASVLIKREVFNKIGLLDEKTFLYMEDADFCIRARLFGYKVVYCPTSVVIHMQGGAAKKIGNQIRKYGLRNRLRTMLKNYSLKSLMKWGSYSLVLNGIISPLAYAKKLQFQNAILHWYALAWNFLNFPVRERIFIQSRRVIDDDEIFKYGIVSKW